MLSKSTPIILFGAGNLASNAIEILRQMGCTILGYISTEEPGTIINGFRVLGDIEYYQNTSILHQEYFHIAIGENSIRYKILNSLQNSQFLASVISEHCYIGANCHIGNGTYVSHGAVLHHHVTVGRCCIIDTGVILEHNVHIGDLVNISPGAVVCGDVRVGNGAIIGAGSTVIEKIKIGENSLIGAGSVVIHDIEPNVTVVGNPVRVIKRRNFFNTYIK
jgi:sugar O-acyltransferase (sialic acid O-acetyltransferase NeuD family)